MTGALWHWCRRTTAALTGVTAAAVLLGGCAGYSGSGEGPGYLLGNFEVPRSDIIIPAPSYETIERDQMVIMQLSQMLERAGENSSDRAELFYELGIVYDRLGLEASARTMFMNALVDRPDFGAVYNFIGIYLTLAGRFQDANESFDSALELNPRDVYANLNRGISLYYAGRPQVALSDFQIFHDADPFDPYRMLWLYFAERESISEEVAQQRLAARMSHVTRTPAEEWGLNLVRRIQGQLDDHELIATIDVEHLPLKTLAEHLCEAYFYLGKLAVLAGHPKLGWDYFHLAIATRKYDFLEYRYAAKEIERLRRQFKFPLVHDDESGMAPGFDVDLPGGGDLDE